MNLKKNLILVIVALAIVSSACKYIVFPEGLEEPEADEVGSELRVWSAQVTGVGMTEAGDLHIDLAIRNDTEDWSTMAAAADQPAVLTTSDGKKTNCDTVYVGTGGHRLAPGFQMRGYSVENEAGQIPQLLYVECKGAAAASGSTLTVEYVSYTGILNDYDTEANKAEGVLELNLDQVVTDLNYPIAVPVDGLIQDPGVSITGLSDNVITLLDVQRVETGFQFTWENFNPTKFALKTHIGTPPVIGADGIIYGVFETLDMAPIPLTPATESVDWTTEVAVPQEVKGFYILLSVESNAPRTYINYALDISDK